MIKAVFFDVDGTLVSHKSKSVPESAKKAIYQLREKGIKVLLATGRHIKELKHLPTQGMEFDGYILLNGQLGLDKDKKVIFSHSFCREDVEGLLRIFNGSEYAFVLVNEEGHYMNFVDDMTRIALKSVSTAIPPVREYQGEALYQATAFILPDQDEEFSKILPKGCKLARWGSHGADIIAADGGKSIGMKFFEEYFGITREEIMAFGDAQNDIDMIEYAGVGIAMGNAEDCLKQIADDVTSDVDDNGVWNALEKYGLI